MSYHVVPTRRKEFTSLFQGHSAKAPAFLTARHRSPWRWKTLTIRTNSTLTMAYCRCKSGIWKETGREKIFSVESSCCQMQEPRMKMAAEFGLLCWGCRKVRDFSQGQKELGVGKGGPRGKRGRNSWAYRETMSLGWNFSSCSVASATRRARHRMWILCKTGSELHKHLFSSPVAI